MVVYFGLWLRPVRCHILLKEYSVWLCTLLENYKLSQQEGQMRALSDFYIQNTQTPPEKICLTSIKASETFQPACQSLRSSKRKRCMRKTITGRGMFFLESAKKLCLRLVNGSSCTLWSRCLSMFKLQSTLPKALDCLLTFTNATGQQI